MVVTLHRCWVHQRVRRITVRSSFLFERNLMRVLVPDNWTIPPLSTATFRTSPTRSASNSSASSTSTVSPTKRSRPSYSSTKRPAPRASSLARRVVTTSGEEQPGRFERDFEEIDELGSGEFGKVIKVRSKSKGNHELYAIKKSKRFEGARHRYAFPQ